MAFLKLNPKSCLRLKLNLHTLAHILVFVVLVGATHLLPETMRRRTEEEEGQERAEGSAPAEGR